jgi:hypothetical protein
MDFEEAQWGRDFVFLGLAEGWVCQVLGTGFVVVARILVEVKNPTHDGGTVMNGAPGFAVVLKADSFASLRNDKPTGRRTKTRLYED